MKSVLLLLISFTLLACSGVNITQWHFPYSMDVEQGTYITNTQYKQLKIGMTKDQVAFIFGPPLTQFLFQQNRWDYIYQDHKNYKLQKSYHLTIMFDNKEQVESFSKVGQLFDK